ncbi:MAG: YihY/virulence factor BrkB family protein [Syntrophorhabdaceae bacterium]|nr:YihY/virulence factor BrkB family protein [Syntrophorhabdaceae bacterium]
MIARMIHFFNAGIWEIKFEGLPFFKAAVVRTARIIVMAIHKFQNDHCQRNASVLTYYSLLNIVPLFAVVFAIAKGFGLEKLVFRQIIQLAADANWQPDVTARIIQFSRSLLSHAKGEIIVGVGIVILFWTVISTLGRIEEGFNTIWEAKRSRTIVRKFTDYLSMMVLGPILLALWSSVNVLIVGEVRGFMIDMGFIGSAGTITLFLLKLLPYFSISILLLVVYLVMPNTRVPVGSAVIAAFVSGTLIQAVQWVYITFQIGVSTQSAIYGSFAAIPLFLAWLQISWTIVLFGAEIAHAAENCRTYGFHPDYSRIGQGTRRRLMLRIFHLLVKRFEAGEKPLSVAETSRMLEIPERFVRQILFDLVDVDLVSEITEGARKESRFQPARAIGDITIKQAMDAYEKNEPVADGTQESDRLLLSLQTLFDTMEKSPANVKLKEI